MSRIDDPAGPVRESTLRGDLTFWQRVGKAARQTLRDSTDWKAIVKTPYGATPMVLFISVGLLNGFASRIFNLAVPDIIRDLRLDVGALLRAVNTFTLLVVIANLGVGWYADRRKRVPLIAAGTIIGGLATFLAGRSNTVPQFAGSQVTGAAGDLLTGIPQSTLTVDYYPVDKRGKVIVASATLGRVAGLSTPVLGAYLIKHYGWRSPFTFIGPAIVVLGLAMFFLLKEPIRGYMERTAAGLPEDLARIPEPAVSFGESWRLNWGIRTRRRLFIAGILTTAGAFAFDEAFSFWLVERYGLDVSQRGLLLFVTGLPLLISGFFAAGLLDGLLRRRPQQVLILTGTLGLFSAMFYIVQASGAPLGIVVGGAILFGMVNSLVVPAYTVIMLQISPPHVRGSGIAIAGLQYVPAIILKGILLNFLDQLGFQGIMFVAIPFLIAGAVVELSSAPLFEPDLRNVQASAAAAAVYRKSREEGTAKALVCRNVEVGYDGVQVLFGVDFDVDDAQIIALLGTNGAGKSTLLKAIAGIQEASGGAILLDGRDITHMPPHEVAARGVVLMPGGRGTFPGMTVRDNLVLGSWLSHDERESRMAQIFEFFPVLRERLGERANLLSGGEQQMLSLAQAFLSRPRILMIDELSLGLSPAVVAQLITILRAIHEQGTTIILVEQSVNVALTIAKTAVFMEKGQVRFVGPTADLLQRPDILRAVYVKGTGALSAGPSARASREKLQRAERLGQSRVVLEARGVNKTFGGISAVTDADLELRDGEVLGLIGPNGAGKTTMFDLLSGYQIADSGTILLDSVDITNMPPEQRAVQGLVRRFQDARLFPSLSVYENVLTALERSLDIRSVPLTALQLPQVRQAERRVRRRADRLIELLELGSYREKFVRELSTGLRRITDLACVLAQEPKVLLLDEPSTGIAQAEAESLGPLLNRVRFETGCSILIIEHDIPLISSIADEIVCMVQGRVLVRGTADVVLNDERVIEAYLGGSEEVIQRSGVRT